MASKKENENRVASINRILGFKGKRTNNGKFIGKEFYLGGEYGRVVLQYRSSKSSKRISDNLTTSEMEEFLKGYRKGLTTKKSDFK